MEQIFGDVFDKKRLAPGLVTRADRQAVRHDCSTLGGNSGSAVVSLATGRAVALHFAGRFLETNFAVPGTVVGQRLQQIRSGSRPGRIVSPPGEGTSATRTSIQSVAPSPGQFSFVVPIRFSVDVGTPHLGSPTDAPATASPEPGPRPEEDDEDDGEVLSEAVPEDYRDLPEIAQRSRHRLLDIAERVEIRGSVSRGGNVGRAPTRILSPLSKAWLILEHIRICASSVVRQVGQGTRAHSVVPS